MAIARKTYLHGRLGEITLIRSGRARRIKLSVRADGEVRLTYPWLVSRHAALEFLESRAEWIEQSRERMARKYPQREKYIEMPYSTRSHALKYRPYDGARIFATLTATEIVVSYPITMNYMSAEVAEVTRKAITETLRAEAKEYLPGRVAQLSTTTGLRYSSVTVRATVSQWGSCSQGGRISLSLYLMLLPDELIDYVIVHELCHTVHCNHSERFHALLDNLLGGRERELTRALKKYRPRV